MSDIEYGFYDPAKARSMVNSARKKALFVRTGVELVTQTAVEDGKEVPKRGYGEMGNLARLTAAAAMEFLADLARFCDQCEASGKVRPTVRLGIADNCIFIG